MKENLENYTLEELIEQIEDSFEYIFGEVYMESPKPIPRHSIIVHAVNRVIVDYLHRNDLEYFVFGSGVDLYLNSKGEVGYGNMQEQSLGYVHPDLFVLCDPNNIKGDGIYGAPDLVVEVASPNTKMKDYNEKLKLYRQSGVKEYWILDYEADLVTLYNFPEVRPERGSFDSEMESKLFPGLRVNFREVKSEVQRVPFYSE